MDEKLFDPLKENNNEIEDEDISKIIVSNVPSFTNENDECLKQIKKQPSAKF